VADAVFTVACVEPKNKMLLEAVVLKFVPVIVTVVDGSAINGLTVLITGGGVTVKVAALLLALGVQVPLTTHIYI
jgi:hypothetical protein